MLQKYNVDMTNMLQN